MKSLLVILSILWSVSVYAQVSISSDGSAPDPSSMLEVKSGSKGFLLPRLSDTERDLIRYPAEGLIIYNTTTKNLNFFNGTNWNEISNLSCVPQPSIAYAGGDQYSSSGNLTLTLNASTPQHGRGTWTILSGSGASFEDVHDPATQFYAALNETYQLRWTVSTACGSTSDDMNIIPIYSHTISIDGINDFIAEDEQVTTTSIGYYAYFSWDFDYFYFAYQGSDIGSSNPFQILSVYIDGLAPTTSTAMMMNTQQAQLPFGAKYLLSWRADNLLQVYSYNGSAWITSNIVASSDYSQNGNFIEFRISRAALGNPQNIKIHGSMLNTNDYSEWTYAGTPYNSFMDGYDPNYTKFYNFLLWESIAPNQYTPLP